MATSQLEVVPLLIDGEPTSSTPAVRFPVFGFESGKEVYLAESADVDTARRAVDASLGTFKIWKKVSHLTRRKILLRYAELLRQREADLVHTQCLETSVDQMWARKNVTLAAGLIEELAACITRLGGEIPLSATAGALALAFTVPVGPVLSIVPWNSSVILGARSLAAPVAAGCTVVLKASELCPKTHHLLVEIFHEAGLPDGVINVVQTRRQDAAAVTEALIAHPGIRKVEFIGSASIGRVIGSLAGKHLKPVLMELGGKGPAIVLADANLEDAARKCATGAFLHHGQLCFSTERIVVVEAVAQDFIALLQKEVRCFKASSAVSERMIQSSLDKLIDAEQKGAKFLAGGAKKSSATSLMPSIVTGVTKEMLLHDEEGFGPSASLYVVTGDAEAIEVANSTRYGLNAAVHSTDMQHALEVAQEIDTAQIHINSMTAHDEPTLPVGGTKSSGWGRNNGEWGLREFTEVKLITISPKGNDFI